MAQVAPVEAFVSAEVTYLPQIVAEAEKLLIEIRSLDRQELSLEILCVYLNQLKFFIEELGKDSAKSYARQVLPELKPRFHAFDITIQKRQNQST